MHQSLTILLLAVGLTASASAADSNTVAIVPRAGKPGPPMLLGTSVMDPAQNQLVKSLGFSHAQTDSDHLTVNEPEPGRWDWTNADAGFAAMQQAGMKWQYFPHFHWPPEWYRQSAKFVPSIGLRSNRRLAAMSIWSPDATPWFEHCYAALARHYDKGQIHAIYVGVHGDFGETLFPMGWHPDEKKYFGTNGVGLPDFWCGDDYARADFRRFARRQYRTLSRLNAAWETSFKDFGQIDYPPSAWQAAVPIPDTPGGRRYWLDFIQWYYDSMTRFTGDVCRIARHYFPSALLEIPVGGGSENVMYGQDTSALPKVALRYGVHVRSTHGGYTTFPQGYAAMIKRIATSCKFYGAPHWLEPPGGISAEGEVSRIMEALSCGNYGFWDWGANPTGAPNVFCQYTNFFTREKPVVDVALFFPTTDHRLHPDVDFPQQLQSTGAQLRDLMDFDMVDEELINDGALKRYRVLLWVEGKFIEEKTLKTLAAWVKKGGALVCWNADPPETVAGDRTPGSELLGLANASASRMIRPLKVTNPAGHEFDGNAVPRGKGWVIAAGGEPAFKDVARTAAYHLSRLDPTKKDAPEVDDVADGVYATLLDNGEIILLNLNSTPTEKIVCGKTLLLPPKSLRSVLWQKY